MTDRQLLDWVRLRAGGVSSGEIGRAYGVPSSKVRIATNRVKAADREASGDDYDPSQYWPD
jgi:DNA-directed RNA polymerase specialized sigma24 family protein